jgi:hypothetical protein
VEGSLLGIEIMTIVHDVSEAWLVVLVGSGGVGGVSSCLVLFCFAF